MKFGRSLIPIASGFWLTLSSCDEGRAKTNTAVGGNTEITELKEKISQLETEIETLKLAAGQTAAPEDTTGGLASDEGAVGREAMAGWAKKGPEALAALREIAFHNDSANARKRAKEAIGMITGQWGSQTDLVWKRSVEDAINPGKPILVLQLFGNLDEEFC